MHRGKRTGRIAEFTMILTFLSSAAIDFRTANVCHGEQFVDKDVLYSYLPIPNHDLTDWL